MIIIVHQTCTKTKTTINTINNKQITINKRMKGMGSSDSSILDYL